VQVDIDSMLCTSVGSSVASGRQINASMSYPVSTGDGPPFGPLLRVEDISRRRT
jgi:hypothetical protein